ncbi:hypothetical protein CFP56_006872 [Quercus suber]|uniref:Uncharacterized protein n=1 Tax=Quercus suber TaxID=58331 RepID=A0AAW0M9G2_QUESU
MAFILELSEQLPSSGLLLQSFSHFSATPDALLTEKLPLLVHPQTTESSGKRGLTRILKTDTTSWGRKTLFFNPNRPSTTGHHLRYYQGPRTHKSNSLLPFFPNSNPSPQPWKEPSSVTSNSKPKPLPQKSPISDHNDRSDLTNDSTPNRKAGKRSYRSEEEVSVHVDTCVNDSVEANGSGGGSDLPDNRAESRSESECCVGAFVYGKPSVEVVLKLKNTIPTYQ